MNNSGDTLTDLLRQASRRHEDATLRRLQEIVETEERARPRGLSLNRTTASQIMRGTYRGLASDGTIRAIAWLANVSEQHAFAAAGRELPGPPFADELPPGVDALSSRERSAIVALAKTFVAQRNEMLQADRAHGDRVVKALVQLAVVQARAEAMVAEDIEPDLELLNDELGVLAYSLHLMALQAYGGDEQRLAQQRTRVALDMRASHSMLARPVHENAVSTGDPDATTYLGEGRVETVGINSDGTYVTTTHRMIDTEYFSHIALEPTSEHEQP